MFCFQRVSGAEFRSQSPLFRLDEFCHGLLASGPLVAAFLLLAAGPGFPQSHRAPVRSAPSRAKWPIEKLVVEGNRHYTREQVLGIAGLKIGQKAGKAEFEAARDCLVATGAFATVGYKFAPSGNGYTAVFQVTEIDQIYPIDFDNLHVSERDLRAALRAWDPLFTGSLPATQPVMDRYVKWIQDYLAAKGVPQKIVASVTPARSGGFEILFQPDVVLPAVAQVTFEGNHVISEDILRKAVAPTAIGSSYTEDRFREILNDSVLPVYEARGRVRVAFPKIRTEPAPGVKGVHVFVTVDEGESYNLGKVTIDGPAPLSAGQLLRAGDFKTGEVANFDFFHEGVERVRKALRHAGYLNAKVTTGRQINDGTKTVDVSLYIDAGPRYLMGKLSINGLDLEGEAAMRRIWTMTQGKPFDPDYPDSFLSRVHAGAMFDNLGQTKSSVKLDDQTHTADVTLVFSGRAAARKP